MMDMITGRRHQHEPGTTIATGAQSPVLNHHLLLLRSLDRHRLACWLAPLFMRHPMQATWRETMGSRRWDAFWCGRTPTSPTQTAGL